MKANYMLIKKGKQVLDATDLLTSINHSKEPLKQLYKCTESLCLYIKGYALH